MVGNRVSVGPTQSDNYPPKGDNCITSCVLVNAVCVFVHTRLLLLGI